MPKLFLNKSNDIFLQEVTQNTSKFTLNTVVIQILESLAAETKKTFLINTAIILRAIADKNKKKQTYFYRDQYTNAGIASHYYGSRGEKEVKLSFINVVNEKSVSEINLGTPTSSAKNYYDLIHNHLDIVQKEIQETIEFIEPLHNYDFGKQETYQGRGIIVCLEGLSKALSEISVQPIDMKKYTLREFKPQDNPIDKKQLYYVVYNDMFLTLAKSRKSFPTFHWALTKNIGSAFLFNGNLSTYALPYEEDKVNKVFVEVNVKAVEKNVTSKLTDELCIRIENRDINSLLIEQEVRDSTPLLTNHINKL